MRLFRKKTNEYYNAYKSVLINWISNHNLSGKKVIEFACGEGKAGVILSQQKCVYYGVDKSQSAINKAEIALKCFPNASVKRLDMVENEIDEKYDAALNANGLHILCKSERKKYLRNAFNSLVNNAPMLFYGVSYKRKGDPNTDLHEDGMQDIKNSYKSEICEAGFVVDNIVDNWHKWHIYVHKP